MTASGVALFGIATVTVLAAGNAHATTTPLSGTQSRPVAGGAYTVQNNEWGSGAPQSITTNGNAGFAVTNSSINDATNAAPGGYPSIYAGCHWGNCTHGGLGAHPVQVTRLTIPGTVTTSWKTRQPGGSAAYDVAYDLWFNHTPAATGQPDGAELMVWLNHHGPVQPFGSQVGTATIGGISYQVWEGAQPWGDTISYVMARPTTSVSNLDVGALAADAVRRGYIRTSWYLIDVEAGFELWRGGAGLATDSFSVNLSGSRGSPASAPPPGPFAGVSLSHLPASDLARPHEARSHHERHGGRHELRPSYGVQRDRGHRSPQLGRQSGGLTVMDRPERRAAPGTERDLRLDSPDGRYLHHRRAHPGFVRQDTRTGAARNHHGGEITLADRLSPGQLSLMV